MKDVEIVCLFGYPGAGKSTHAAYVCNKALKHNKVVYSNVPLKGAFILDPKEDLGKFLVQDCIIIIDEASIEFNNRRFKEFPKQCIEFFKLHRHYKCQIYCYSQSYDDIDVTIRRLCHRLYWIRNSILPFFIKLNMVSKSFDCIEGEPKDIYKIHRFPFKLIFCPPCWKLFNSHSYPLLDSKDWLKYE